MKQTVAPIVLLLTFLLAGCGSAGRSVHGTTLRIWYSTDDPVERGWSQVLARRFEAKHPQVHVNLIDYNFADLNTKLQLALSGGTPPDLAYVTPRGPGIPAYVGAHRLRDLTAAARTDRWASRLRPGLLVSYNRPFEGYGAQRGQVTAVPMTLAAVGVLYNRWLLKRLNVPVPHTLRAFEHALERAKEAGFTPLGLGNADGWLGDDWYLTLVNTLVSPSSLQAEQRLSPHFSFLRPDYLKAGYLLQHWAKSGYFTQDFGGLDAQEGVLEFFRGHTLFQLVSSSENPQIAREEQRTHLGLGVFAFPGANGRAVMPVAGYLGWVVPAANQHSALAESFIDSVLSVSSSRLLLGQGVLPASRLVSSESRRKRTYVSGGAHWQEEYLHALDTSRAGVYLDAAPVANLNATMEANVQLLLQGYEPPEFLVKSLQDVYASRGKHGSTARIDGEF
ncbi:MAG: hypothetical protein NVSMB52_06020 [Chloroflexota bacterium]